MEELLSAALETARSLPEGAWWSAGAVAILGAAKGATRTAAATFGLVRRGWKAMTAERALSDRCIAIVREMMVRDRGYKEHVEEGAKILNVRVGKVACRLEDGKVALLKVETAPGDHADCLKVLSPREVRAVAKIALEVRQAIDREDREYTGMEIDEALSRAAA